MKRIIKYLCDKLGYSLVNNRFYEENTVSLNKVAELDFYYILRRSINREQPICCFDIGANNGQTAQKFRSYFPNAAIYSFEPIKDTYLELVENLVGYTNINTYNLALGAKQGEVEIFHRKHSQLNSLVEQLNKDAQEEGAIAEVIKVDTIDNFVAREGITKIDILKSDTEGFELEVLKGAKNCLEKGLIQTLYVEVGFSKKDFQHSYWVPIAEELEKYGYQFQGLFEKCYDYSNALFCSKAFIDGK